MALEEDIDRLYGLELPEFTPARNELAKRLRSGGEREAAERVKALKKPSTAAWAVNQVVRGRKKDARRLLDAGERLRKVHGRLGAGKASADELREAAANERDAVEALMDAARGLRGSGGEFLRQPVLEKVEETLHAAASDEETRAAVESGRLEAERRAAALGVFGGGAAAPPARPAKRKEAKPGREDARPKAAAKGKPSAKPVPERERDVARERARAERERETERKRRLAELRKLTRSGEAQVERLRKRAAIAERRREDAEAAAKQAKAAEKEAREEARDLERELGKARRELGKLGG